MRSTIVISTLLPLLLLLTPATATEYKDKPLTLDRALRKYCLGKYADFIIKYPDPATDQTDIIVFAPTNKAVKQYLLANPDPIPDEPSTSSAKLNKRADPAKNTANKNNVATGASSATSFSSTPPKGSIIATGGGGTSGNKVVKPAGAGGSKRSNDWNRYGDKDYHWDKDCAYDYHAYEDAKPIALISAGGGARTNIKAEGLPFNNGKIVVVDNFFAPAADTSSYLNSDDLSYLNKIFERLPEYKKLIFEASSLTFLAPTAKAFYKAGYSEIKSPSWDLKQFLDDHTIRTGFVGYTPAFLDNKCYRTASDKGFYTTFDGTKTKVNDYAAIVREDVILNNGVIQVIDKVLSSWKADYPPKACYKELFWLGN